MKRYNVRNRLVSDLLTNTLVEYPSPSSLSYLWSFGVLAGLVLVIQIVTGALLTMFYAPNAEIAFMSIENMMRDVNDGWLLRYLHLNGASFFFTVVYLHIFRGIYYGSYKYPRSVAWYIGCTIFVLLMGIAFLGYVLPWGQMSFWAATVIINFFSVIPFVGQEIVYWLWGGFAVDNPTLNRFFSLHLILPFVLAGLSVVHILALHYDLSNNPDGIRFAQDYVPFHPYYTAKDLFGVVVLFFFLNWFFSFYPDYLGHSDNYIPANPLQTPSHIVPEWYFLSFYAILRSIYNKAVGLVLMFAAILILFLLPVFSVGLFRTVTNKSVFYSLFFILAAMTILGSASISYSTLTLGIFSIFIYFLNFALLFFS